MIEEIELLQYLSEAREKEPEGIICGFCGNPNDFADDVGWFYILSPFIMYDRIYKPCCRGCFYGKIGDFHKEIYGVGDR